MPNISVSLIETVESIYDAAPEPANWPRALDRIVGCFGDKGAILQWKKDDSSFGTIATGALIEAQRDYVEGGWSERDLKAHRALERGYFNSGVPFCDRHVCTDHELTHDPFCSEFLIKHGLGLFGAISVSPAPNIGVLLSIQRDIRMRPAFSDSELSMLADIGRHVEKSLRLSIKLLEIDAINIGIGQALSSIEYGVFALDSLGRVLFSNASGDRLAGDLVEFDQGRLRIRHKLSQKNFEEQIVQHNVGGLHASKVQSKPVIARSHSGRQYVLYLIPISRPSHLSEDFLTTTRTIVVAIEHKIGDPHDPALVRDLLGVTLGEARVAALVGSGLSPKETALRLGIALETVRSLLKHVFHKVGVSRQGELVALLTRMTIR